MIDHASTNQQDPASIRIATKAHGERTRFSLRSAFTLIELLVVIAVISVLAALLLSALSSAKLRAKQIQCLNNIREMGLASIMYTQDYHGNTVPYDIAGAGLLWMGKLIDYQSKVDAVRLCPVAAEITGIDTNRATQWGTADNAWAWRSPDHTRLWSGSYCFNGWLYSDLRNRQGVISTDDAPGVFSKEFNVLYPAQTPLFADGVWLDAWPRTNDPPAADLYNGFHGSGFNGKIGRLTIPRHLGFVASRAPRQFDSEQRLPSGINVVCFDGHVETSKLENLWNYYWSRTWTPQNPRPD
jgi:prepilin-type N-terminal cleavage/methylation domain-containing protein